MKKVITGTLITAIMSNNVVYASEIVNNQSTELNENADITQPTENEVEDILDDVTQSEENLDLDLESEKSEESVDLESKQPEENIQDSNENGELLQDNESEKIVQAISQNTNTGSGSNVNKTQKDVHNFTELQDALKQSNITINIKSNIKFDAPINIIGQNITINGDGKKFDLNQTDDTNRFVIKGNADNIEINNLTFDNYYTTGIYISAKNINLKDITLTGKSIDPSKARNAKAGIDISDANTTVTLENITSQNHLQSGIRVKKGAHVTIKGTNVHENDAVDLQSVLDNGVNTNVIDFDNNQYIEDSKNTKQVNYRSKTLNASTFESLKKAVTKSDSVINLKENIKLTETLI